MSPVSSAMFRKSTGASRPREGCPAAVELHHGLVVHAQLVGPQGPPQFGLRLQPPQGGPGHVGVEELVAGPAPVLGHVHGDVGVAEQVLGSLTRAGHGDANAGRHEQVSAQQREGRPEGLSDAIGDGDGARRVRDAVDEHEELVASHPGHRVARTKAVLDAAGHVDEELVARLVPEAVVHDLEAVEVEEQDRHRPRFPVEAG